MKEAPYEFTYEEVGGFRLAFLIKSEEEFQAFLSDEAIFKRNPDEKFMNFNSTYNVAFFEEKDLVIVINSSGPSGTKGFKLKDISKENGVYVLDMRAIVPFNCSGLQDVGFSKHFTYYIAVKKDPGMNSVSFTDDEIM